jgi:hypothetical protein
MALANIPEPIISFELRWQLNGSDPETSSYANPAAMAFTPRRSILPVPKTGSAST